MQPLGDLGKIEISSRAFPSNYFEIGMWAAATYYAHLPHGFSSHSDKRHAHPLQKELGELACECLGRALHAQIWR